ncbi:DUF1344 domain-containing protein [Nitratireductor sp. GCM10026969]|uniref:PilY2 family type 4a fimbrial biogenesis protein n=1 Tax=Nitratireductor sp. GCM10026969 TaxID=3252645 RepID=UPI00361E6297
MRKFLAAAVAASVMGAASIASAGTFTSTGVIESVNTKTNTVRIRDGDAYRLPTHVDLSGLTAGQRVHVSWDSQNPSSTDDRHNSDEWIWVFDATGIERAG